MLEHDAFDARRFAEAAREAWGTPRDDDDVVPLDTDDLLPVDDDEVVPRDGKLTVALRGSLVARLRRRGHDPFLLAVAATVVMRRLLPVEHRREYVERLIEVLLAARAA